VNIKFLLSVILLLAACSAPEVRCDRHLQPINLQFAPGAPAVPAAQAGKASMSRSAP
jgi:hypothetical protein